VGEGLDLDTPRECVVATLPAGTGDPRPSSSSPGRQDAATGKLLPVDPALDTASWAERRLPERATQVRSLAYSPNGMIPAQAPDSHTTNTESSAMGRGESSENPSRPEGALLTVPGTGVRADSLTLASSCLSPEPSRSGMPFSGKKGGAACPAELPPARGVKVSPRRPDARRQTTYNGRISLVW